MDDRRQGRRFDVRRAREALNEAGYARYDERTSTMLGETAQFALDRYGGDLRRLRAEADRDPGRERRLLKEFKGLADDADRVRRVAAGEPADGGYAGAGTGAASKSGLYERAQLGVSGRSRMSKQELAEALEHAEGGAPQGPAEARSR